MIVTINGRRWALRWWPFGRGATDGECDSPGKARKEIRIRNSLNRPDRQKRLMEVAIHESLHALHWGLDEGIVESGAEDIAALLWKLGYRRTEWTG